MRVAAVAYGGGRRLRLQRDVFRPRVAEPPDLVLGSGRSSKRGAKRQQQRAHTSIRALAAARLGIRRWLLGSLDPFHFTGTVDSKFGRQLMILFRSTLALIL